MDNDLFKIVGIWNALLIGIKNEKQITGVKKMTQSDQIIIKLEFDRSVKYLDKENITVSECMQEIGHLRQFIYNIGIDSFKRNF